MNRNFLARLVTAVATMSVVATSFVGVGIAAADGGNENGDGGDNGGSRSTSKQWTILPSSNAPSYYSYDANAKDANGNVVSFGGSNAAGYSNATRIYSYGAWSTVTPATSPAARSGARMVWDAALNADVLYGGGYLDRYSQPVNLTDTWKWNGVTWTQITTAHNPGALTGFNMSYDASRSTIYLWGGYYWATNTLNTTLWAFNGTDWVTPTVTGSKPVGRQNFAFAYDPDIQANVLFGGCQVSSGCTNTYSDTWIQAGATWTKLDKTGPSRQYGSTFGYSPTLGGVLLQGGFDGSNMTSQSYILSGSSVSSLAWTKNTLYTGAALPTDFTAFIGDLSSAGSTYVMEVAGSPSAPGQTKATAYVMGDAPTAPNAPSNVVVTATSGSAVTVTWTAPNSNGADISSYTVKVGEKSCTATAPATTCSITGIRSEDDKSLTATVIATNAIGKSPAGSSASFKMPKAPGAPKNVSATSAGATSAAISWNVPESDGGLAITSYTVTSDPGRKTCTATAPALTCTVSGLLTKTGYTFSVKATNSVGTGEGSSASNLVGTATAPGAPNSVMATAGAGKATIAWTAPTSDGGATITSYTAKATPGNKTCTATAPALTCDINNLSTNGVYTFTVTATNPAGTGPASSATTSTTILDSPTAPLSPRLVGSQFGAALGQLTASWSAPTRNGGSTITSYTATLNPGGFTCTVFAPTTSCVFNGGNNNGLQYATTYTLSVVANTAIATGPAATTTGSLSVNTIAPTFGNGSITYGTDYYGTTYADYSVQVNCPSYWGSSVGTVSVTLTGSATYPNTVTVNTTTTGCGQLATFRNLPAFGEYTLSATASNDVSTSPTTTKSFVSDGPLSAPRLLVTYNPTTSLFTMSVSAATSGKALAFALTDTTSNNPLACSKVNDGSFTCTETVLANSGLGVILQANLNLVVTSGANYAGQTFTYPVVINRLACPSGYPTCTTIIGNYYQLNRGNLIKQDLSGLDLSYSYISNTDMSRAKLANTNMDKIKMINDNLTNAQGLGAPTSMQGAYLNNVTFTGAKLNLQLAQTSTGNMPKTFTTTDVYASGGVIANGYWIAAGLGVYNADLSGVDLSNIGSLDAIQFVNDNLSGVNFTGDLLTRAYIANCNLNGTYLSTDDLTGTSSSGNTGVVAAIGSAFRVVGGSIFGPGVVVMRKNLSGLNLSNLDLTGAIFKNSDLRNVNFTNSNLTRVNIAQSSGSGQTVFNPGLLTGANFTNAIMTGMWGISDSASYIGSTTIAVTGSAPAALPFRVSYDSVNHQLVLR